MATVTAKLLVIVAAIVTGISHVKLLAILVVIVEIVIGISLAKLLAILAVVAIVAVMIVTGISIA